MVLVKVFGLIDITVGILILISNATFLSFAAKYIGFALIIKGLWSVFS